MKSDINMAYNVELTDKAALDTDQTFKWIAERSPALAAIWFDGLLDAIGSLETFQFRCPIALDGRKPPGEVRQLLYGTNPAVYRIIFEDKQQTVFVLHVRHGARGRLA